MYFRDHILSYSVIFHEVGNMLSYLFCLLIFHKLQVELVMFGVIGDFGDILILAYSGYLDIGDILVFGILWIVVNFMIFGILGYHGCWDIEDIGVVGIWGYWGSDIGIFGIWGYCIFFYMVDMLGYDIEYYGY